MEPLTRRLVLVGVLEPQDRHPPGRVPDVVAQRARDPASSVLPVSSAAHIGAIFAAFAVSSASSIDVIDAGSLRTDCSAAISLIRLRSSTSRWVTQSTWCSAPSLSR